MARMRDRLLRITPFFYAAVLVCYCTVSPAAGLATEVAGTLTVTTVVAVEDLSAQDQIWLTRVLMGGAGDERLAFGVVWEKRQSGWFSQWSLSLVGAPEILPPAQEATTQYPLRDGLVSYALLNVPPTVGHEYETVLSYAADLGGMAIRVTDQTDRRVIYHGAVSALAYDEPLLVLDGSLQRAFLPVGTTWNVGIREPGGTWLPIRQFHSRSADAWIRLDIPHPVPAAGEFRVVVLSEEHRRELARVAVAPGSHWLPLALDEIPYGPSTLELAYVREEEVLFRDTLDITLGSITVTLGRLDVDREAGRVTSTVQVFGGEPIDRAVQLVVRAVLERMVWDEARRTFQYQQYDDVTVYAGPVDLTSGLAVLPFAIDLPDMPANWRVRLAAETTPTIKVDIGDAGRLFSTHLPAQVAEAEAYTIVVFPDTQFFAARYPEVLTRMTDWVAANAAERNIVAVLHVGDVTHNNTRVEWARAYASFSLLHGIVPYVITLGNHDMTEGGGGQVAFRGKSLFGDVYSVDEARRYFNLAGALELGRLDNYYATFSAGETEYLVIALEFGPPDEALAWANEVARLHPEHRLIVLTHAYTLPSGSRSRSPAHYPIAENPHTTVNSAPEIWDKFIRRHANSFMVLSGHVTAPLTIPYNVAIADTGRFVYELLFDYQEVGDGGDGWLGLLTFCPDNTLHAAVYSPYLGAYASEADLFGFSSEIVIDLSTGRVKRISDAGAVNAACGEPS